MQLFLVVGCPYCVRAKELAEKLTEERDDFNFRYVDIHAEGITKADLEKLSVSRLKPYRRSSSIRNTLAAAPTLKLTPKSTWACLLPSNEMKGRPHREGVFICGAVGYEADCAQISSRARQGRTRKQRSSTTPAPARNSA